MYRILIILILFFCTPAFAQKMTVVGGGSGTVRVSAPWSGWVNDTGIYLSSSIANNSANGLMIQGTAGEALGFDDLVYMKSDGKFWKAQANSSTTMACIGMSMSSTGANGAVTVLLQGTFRSDALTFTVGSGYPSSGFIWVSAATAGLATSTQPATTGNQLQVVGYALTSHIGYFNPRLAVSEVP